MHTTFETPQEVLQHIESFPTKAWFYILTPKQQDLTQLTARLYSREVHDKTEYSDYSFLVFPLSKVYEGFLKKFFLSLKLIDHKTYMGKKFRIGRALNPDVRRSQRDEWWLFDDLCQHCGFDMAQQLWETWLASRNRIFHYFPEVDDYMNLETAANHLVRLSDAMQTAIECNWQEFDEIPKHIIWEN